MQITKIDVFKVNIPLTRAQRWAGGVNRGWTRCVVRMSTDDGIDGYGECLGSASAVALIDEFKSAFVGADPFDLTAIMKNFWWASFYHGVTGKNAAAALETCCWDIMGKAVGRPLSDLLGGRVREQVPLALSVFQPTDVALSPEQATSEVTEAIESSHYGTIKLKAGVLPPENEVAILNALRGAFPDAQLRLDPNGIWAVETAIRVAQRLHELDLEYLEDPVWGPDAMSRVRQRVAVPLATNMCVVGLDELPVGVRMGSVDVVLLDPHEWGGLTACRKGAAVCEAFRVGIGLHSGGEAGISTALHLHVAASLPVLPHAIDSFYSHQADDFLSSRHEIADGAMVVPAGPGLGVEVDVPKLQFLSDKNEREGDLVFYADAAMRRTAPYMGQW